MRFLARLNADPAAWLLVLVIGAVTVRVIGLVATEAIATAVRAVRRSS